MAVFQMVGGGSSAGRKPGGVITFGGGAPAQREGPQAGPPVLGIRNFGNLLGSLPGGLFQLAKNIVIPWIPGEQEGEEDLGEFWAGFGSGLLKSLTNTGAAIVDAPGTLASGVLTLIPGEQPGEEWLREGLVQRALTPLGIRPDRTAGEMFHEQGLLGPIVEGIGNVSLAGAAGAGALKLGARAAELGGEGALRATMAAREAAMLNEAGRAYNAARVGAGYPEVPVAFRSPFPIQQGVGRAGALEQAALRLERYAHPYREFLFPPVRKVLGGGTVRVPSLFRRAATRGVSEAVEPPPEPLGPVFGPEAPPPGWTPPGPLGPVLGPVVPEGPVLQGPTLRDEGWMPTQPEVPSFTPPPTPTWSKASDLREAAENSRALAEEAQTEFARDAHLKDVAEYERLANEAEAQFIADEEPISSLEKRLNPFLVEAPAGYSELANEALEAKLDNIRTQLERNVDADMTDELVDQWVLYSELRKLPMEERVARAKNIEADLGKRGLFTKGDDTYDPADPARVEATRKLFNTLPEVDPAGPEINRVRFVAPDGRLLGVPDQMWIPGETTFSPIHSFVLDEIGVLPEKIGPTRVDQFQKTFDAGYQRLRVQRTSTEWDFDVSGQRLTDEQVEAIAKLVDEKLAAGEPVHVSVNVTPSAGELPGEANVLTGGSMWQEMATSGGEYQFFERYPDGQPDASGALGQWVDREMAKPTPENVRLALKGEKVRTPKEMLAEAQGEIAAAKAGETLTPPSAMPVEVQVAFDWYRRVLEDPNVSDMEKAHYRIMQREAVRAAESGDFEGAMTALEQGPLVMKGAGAQDIFDEWDTAAAGIEEPPPFTPSPLRVGRFGSTPPGVTPGGERLPQALRDWRGELGLPPKSSTPRPPIGGGARTGFTPPGGESPSVAALRSAFGEGVVKPAERVSRVGQEIDYSQLPQQYRPPSARRELFPRREIELKGSRPGRFLVRAFDTGRLAKTAVRLTNADARGAVFKVQVALTPMLKQFQELTPDLTDAERSLILGEELRYQATQGGVLGEVGREVQMRERIAPARKGEVKPERRSEALKEIRKLEGAKRAQAEAAIAHADVQAGIARAVDEVRGWNKETLAQARTTVFGDEGIEPDVLDFKGVRDTETQARQRAEAEAALRIGGEQAAGQQGLFAPEVAVPGAVRKLDDIARQQERAPLPSQVAPKYRTMARALRDVRRAQGRAYRDAGLTAEEAAAALDSDGLTWNQIIDRAEELGFNPVHIPEFSEEELGKLVNGAMSVGRGFRRATRTRGGGTIAQSEVSHSLEALAAGFIEVSLEHRSAEFLKGLMDSQIAQKVPPTGIPDDWVGFRINREGMEQLLSGGVDEAGDWMVPKGIHWYLKTLAGDYSHPILTGIQKVTNPWRALVLTASPKWYFNNAIGNGIMATAHGVRLRDWSAAWKSKGFDFKDLFTDAYYRRFPELDPQLKRSSLAYEGVQESTVGGILPPGKKAVRRALRFGGTKTEKATGALRVIGERAQRMNEIVDEVARAALYEKELRVALKRGMPHDRAVAQAVDKAVKGLVDYSNLTPFERQVVRSVIPFYAWQKGILQMSARLAIDHPARVRATMMIGQANNEWFQQEEAEVPEYLRGMIGLPGSWNLRTRRFNPFADADTLLDFDKVKDSINPFIDILLGRLYREDETMGFGAKELNQYGRAVPHIPAGSRALELLTGSPLGLLPTELIGGERPAAEVTTGFFGPSVISDQSLSKVNERMQRAIQQVQTAAPLPPRSDQGGGSSTFALIKPPSRRSGRALRSPVRFGEALRADRTL